MIELPELRNVFKGGKKLGAGIDSCAYHAQLKDVERGNPQFVLSRSELMLFASNPSRWINGYAPKGTDATEWGSLIDCLLTDPGRFEAKFALQPLEQLATKTMRAVKEGEARVGDFVPWSPLSSFAKEWKEQALESGKIIVNAKDQVDSREALLRIRQDPLAGKFIACSAMQVMCVSNYFDRETKITVPVKCLIDFVPALDTEFQNDLGDFKTARNGSPEEWQGIVEKRHYDVQAAMNLDIYAAATGEERTGFRHVVQESEFPFAVGRRLLESPTITIGRMKMQEALRLYCKCLAVDSWPTWDDMPCGEFNNYAGWTGISPKQWTLTRYLGQGVRAV